MKKFNTNNYSLIVIISWTVIIFLLWLQYIHLSTLTEATLMLIVLIPVISISCVLTNIWLPEAIYRKRLKIFAPLFIGAVFFMAFLLAASYQLLRWAETKGYFPHSTLLADNNSLFLDFLFAIPSTLIINFGFCGLRFLYEHLKLQKVHLETRVQALQSQINPHFMFNILNHIHILIQTDVGLASSLLLQYSDVLRYQLYSGKNESVKLEQEIRFLKNFIGIERVRWGDKVAVSCTWNIEDKDRQIPPLIFITFIENAFKHVSRSHSEPNFIRISFMQKENRICLDIENSKSDIPPKRDGCGLGLENVKKRLDLLYRKDYRLIIDKTDCVYRSKLEIWQR